jgi:hypothetical protein
MFEVPSSSASSGLRRGRQRTDDPSSPDGFVAAGRCQLVSGFWLQKQARSPGTGAVNDILAIDFPDWVLILAITADKNVVMVRQYPHGIEKICLAFQLYWMQIESKRNFV